MAKTIVGLFDTLTEAQGAVQELVNKGFPRDNISIAANNATGEYTQSTASSEEWSGTATGATTGAAIGGIGGLLVGLGVLAIPGIGPIVAAGPLIAALTGAGIGAVAGGLIPQGYPEDVRPGFGHAVLPTPPGWDQSSRPARGQARGASGRR